MIMFRDSKEGNIIGVFNRFRNFVVLNININISKKYLLDGKVYFWYLNLRGFFVCFNVVINNWSLYFFFYSFDKYLIRIVFMVSY